MQVNSSFSLGMPLDFCSDGMGVAVSSCDVLMATKAMSQGVAAGMTAGSKGSPIGQLGDEHCAQMVKISSVFKTHADELREADLAEAPAVHVAAKANSQMKAMDSWLSSQAIVRHGFVHVDLPADLPVLTLQRARSWPDDAVPATRQLWQAQRPSITSVSGDTCNAGDFCYTGNLGDASNPSNFGDPGSPSGADYHGDSGSIVALDVPKNTGEVNNIDLDNHGNHGYACDHTNSGNLDHPDPSNSDVSTEPDDIGNRSAQDCADITPQSDIIMVNIKKRRLEGRDRRIVFEERKVRIGDFDIIFLAGDGADGPKKLSFQTSNGKGSVVVKCRSGNVGQCQVTVSLGQGFSSSTTHNFADGCSSLCTLPESFNFMDAAVDPATQSVTVKCLIERATEHVVA